MSEAIGERYDPIIAYETAASWLAYIQDSVARYLRPGIIPYISVVPQTIEDGYVVESPSIFEGVFVEIDDRDTEDPKLLVRDVTEVLTTYKAIDEDIVIGSEDTKLFAISSISMVIMRFHNPAYRNN